MIKADIFNNLLNEVHKKEEKERQVVRQKQLEIQENMKRVEDALSDMHEKFKQALSKGTEYPKYAIIQNILCEEVKKELIINQGFLIDEEKEITRLFYNQDIFNEWQQEKKTVGYKLKSLEDEKRKAYDELTKSCLKNNSKSNQDKETNNRNVKRISCDEEMNLTDIINFIESLTKR